MQTHENHQNSTVHDYCPGGDFGCDFLLITEFVLKPLNADIAFLQSDLKDKQAKLDAAKQMLAKYDEFKKKSAAILRELEWAQGRMPIQLDKSEIY